MDTKQVRTGVIISYILIIVNTLYGLFLTPYILGHLGDAEYGVYKSISSLSASLMVLDLGLGNTMMRYISNFRAKKAEEVIPNYIAMNYAFAGVLCIFVFAIAMILYNEIGPIYSNTFTAFQIEKAKKLYLIMIVNLLAHIFENVVNGVITGYNRFGFGNGIKLIRLMARIILIYFVLRWIQDSIFLVYIDLTTTLFFLAIELYYVRKQIGIKAHFSKWDRTLFAESGKYTIFMFLTSIAAQVNNNLDNVVIGALKGPSFVAVYSMGLLIFSMFENLSSSVSGVMLPTVTSVLEENDANNTIISLIVRVGRFQFALLGAVFVGFLCIGKDFVKIWLGNGYEDVYIITLILMLPSMFELCVNVCLSILRAKNIIGFRTGVLFISTLLNAIITLYLVKNWSYIGAAWGTAASFVIGSLIVMNIYYKRKLGLPMLKIYRKIFYRIWICLFCAGGILLGFSRFVSGNWIALLLDIVVFSLVYAGLLLSFGLNADERQAIKLSAIF